MIILITHSRIWRLSGTSEPSRATNFNNLNGGLCNGHVQLGLYGRRSGRLGSRVNVRSTCKQSREIYFNVLLFGTDMMPWPTGSWDPSKRCLRTMRNCREGVKLSIVQLFVVFVEVFIPKSVEHQAEDRWHNTISCLVFRFCTIWWHLWDNRTTEDKMNKHRLSESGLRWHMGVYVYVCLCAMLMCACERARICVWVCIHVSVGKENEKNCFYFYVKP